MDICVGVDEYDELGETGGNSSIDAKALNHYSDLHRAHYIHKVACSPKDTMDKNCIIILDVMGADKKHKFTRCWVYYNLFYNQMERAQLVGYIDIDVSHVLKTQFYKAYEKRKMHRLSLNSKYGIRHERDIYRNIHGRNRTNDRKQRTHQHTNKRNTRKREKHSNDIRSTQAQQTTTDRD